MAAPKRLWLYVEVGLIVGLLIAGIALWQLGRGNRVATQSQLPPIDPTGQLPTDTVEEVTESLPPPPSIPPIQPERRKILEDRDGIWALYARDFGAERCLELTVRAVFTSDALLCGAPAAQTHVGRLAVVDTPEGRIAVAVVDPSVSAFDPLPQTGGRIWANSGQAAADVAEPGMAYGAGIISDRDGAVELLIESGEDKIAGLTIPRARGTFEASNLNVRTSAPYGRRPGYRMGTRAGLFWGGHQQLGFYDDDARNRCVLFARFLGPNERTLFDGCPASDASRPAVLATLVATGVPDRDQYVQTVVISDSGIDGFRCRLPSGEDCSSSTTVATDPAGSGRTVVVEFASDIFIGEHDHVILTLLRAGAEVGEVTAYRQGNS